MLSIKRKIVIVVLTTIIMTGCGTNWIPIVVNALGIIQAAAIADTTLSNTDQVAIVKFCTSATATVNAATSGWQAAVSTALTQIEASLSTADKAKYLLAFAGLQMLLQFASQ